MATTTTDTPAKPDNLLGICHAVGETFGFNPLWLRVLLAIAFIVNFEIAVGAYALLGIAVLTGNLIARITRPAAPASPPEDQRPSLISYRLGQFLPVTYR